MQWSLMFTTCRNHQPTLGFATPLEHDDSRANPPLPSLSCHLLENNTKINRNDGYNRWQSKPGRRGQVRAPISPPCFVQSLRPHQQRLFGPWNPRKVQPSKPTSIFRSKHTNEISIHIYKHTAPGVCLGCLPLSCTSPPSCPPTRSNITHTHGKETGLDTTVRVRPDAGPISHLLVLISFLHTAHTKPLQPPVGAARVGTVTSTSLESRHAGCMLPRHRHMRLCVAIRQARVEEDIYPDRPASPSRPRECRL
ncbi:hypothetical protein QBC39DRAFT_115 [Podospora conica]|nr:hypothetical protein QBC39DRAFT_115 [Schizothecium conicum]